MQSPSVRYHAGVTHGDWHDDATQHTALKALDRLYHASSEAADRTLLSRLGMPRTATIKGLYLWGKVGRGKTFLMDLLVAALPPKQVLRVHFHQFMQDVHAALRQIPHQRDPLVSIVDKLAEQTHFLCLDEFQVIDIGDAMLLAGLLHALFASGMVLVTTSNTPPGDLYRGGLQHARFEPAIALLGRHCQILQLDSAHDWRLRALHQTPMYLRPPGAQADHKLAMAFDALACGPAQSGGTITINQRQLTVRRRADNVVWFDFEDLCEGPRAVADYLHLAQQYQAVLISGVPQFNPDHEDTARRFVHLIDALYDHQLRLMVSAMVPIVDLYDGNRLRAEFARTESRLIEMQSADY